MLLRSCYHSSTILFITSLCCAYDVNSFQIGKKAYVQLQTTMGNLNIELHCDIAMRTCWNFITLCNKGFYDGLTFHRLVPDFMIQTGDPTGPFYVFLCTFLGKMPYEW